MKSAPMRIRVGGGGGIGCPEAAAAAFAMGADFILTGTINQLSRQAGTCDQVRQALSEATYSDVTMAPAADMFDMGVELQVLKKGTMFPGRAKQLYELFIRYPSLEALPAETVAKIEKSTFKQPIAAVWAETVKFTLERLKDPEKIARAEKDPKLKMSLVFRWYLSKSSNWANKGIPERKSDFQVWCGPAIGSFNDFIRGTHMDPKVAGKFPDVYETNLQVLRGACFLRRCEQLKADPRLMSAVDAAAYAPYRPEPLPASSGAAEAPACAARSCRRSATWWSRWRAAPRASCARCRWRASARARRRSWRSTACSTRCTRARWRRGSPPPTW